MKMKNNLSNKEKAELTYKEIQLRRQRKSEGEKQAKGFLIENAYRSCKKNRHSKSRGVRSL